MLSRLISSDAKGYVRSPYSRAPQVVLLAAMLAGCGPADKNTFPPKIAMLTAASTVDAMEDVARIFEQHSEFAVEISTGPSNGLARQIMAGAPADIFLSASEKWTDALAAEGFVRESVPLLSNRIVLIVPSGNPAGIAGPNDLRSAGVRHVAIAGENVPAGIYAEQALRYLNLFELLQAANKLARGSDVRVTMTYVERGDAEAGIVYASDARISQDVEIIAHFDPRTYESVVYPVVLLDSASKKPAARAFFRFLQSPEAAAVFSRYGFSQPFHEQQP